METSSCSFNYGDLKTSMNYSTLSLNSIASNISTLPRQNDLSTEFEFCLTKKVLMNNRELMEAIKSLNPEYMVAETEDEITNLSEKSRKYFFICDSFNDNVFKILKRKGCRICAPPFLVYLYSRKRPIPSTSRPLFNGSMFGIAVCFTGFATKREAVSKLADLVHYMGGSVRKDFTRKITHIVANLAQGQKYKAAVNLGKEVMTEQWILDAWERRHDPFFKASKEDYVKQHQMKPFHGLNICLLGFAEDENEHMKKLAVDNGGVNVDLQNSQITHLVIEENYRTDISPDLVKNVAHIVRREWFWMSIQLDVCAEESLYVYSNDYGTPIGNANKGKKKRKLLNASDLSELFSPGSPYFAIANKRQSREGGISVISATFDSSMGSPYPDSNFNTPDASAVISNKPQITKRHQCCLELQQTERNYVEILKTIIQVFKEPLEASTNQRGGPLLAPEEIKTVFGAIPDLLEVHEKLLSEVNECINSWNEDRLIGKAIYDCADMMMKAYPGFVNYFEMIKETINTCDKEKPRFHAFLKLCLSNPDCGRQSLTELLIRPVQRLPSMSLLINDIKKKTDEKNPDYPYLVKASDAIKNVLTHINEDKRKTESQVQMFEILRDVDNCPPYVLSSNRILVATIDVVEVGEGFHIKYDLITIFLFNDSIEIAKRKNKNVTAASTTSTAKSPALQSIQRGGQQSKTYKHVEFIQLAHVKSIVDVTYNEKIHDCEETFGIVHCPPSEEKDQLNIYKVVNNTTMTKQEWMDKISQCLMQIRCATETENVILSVDASSLFSRHDLSDIKDRSGSITKALKKAKGGFGKKMVRAFKTAGKENKHQSSLKRAFSSATPLNEMSDDTPTKSLVFSPAATGMSSSVMDLSEV